MKKLYIFCLVLLCMASPMYAKSLQTTEDTILIPYLGSESVLVPSGTKLITIMDDTFKNNGKECYLVNYDGKPRYVPTDVVTKYDGKSSEAAAVKSEDTVPVSEKSDLSDTDLSARIEELEQRICALEEIVSRLDKASTTESPVVQTGDAVTLATGTWIVGEDISAGKYNITCPSGEVSLKLYDSYEIRKQKDYSYFERYNISSQSYYDEMKALLGESVSTIYSVQANNVRLENGNCIFSEGTAVFAPVK